MRKKSRKFLKKRKISHMAKTEEKTIAEIQDRRFKLLEALTQLEAYDKFYDVVEELIYYKLRQAKGEIP